jgi:hypothetical protein
MNHPVFKVGVAGTHSTGKTTFLNNLALALSEHNLSIGRIEGVAERARKLGFPILRDHTFESTLWIMAEVLRQEAEASLTRDVVLVDRPIVDALGYLEAALDVSGRSVCPRRIEQLKIIARATTGDYDLLITTCLDEEQPLGAARDPDSAFRLSVAGRIESLMSEFAPNARRLTYANAHSLLAEVVETILSRKRTLG